MLPLISIIIPIYNVEQYLERCLLSIVSQSYENFEVILVNDGSTDNSKLICEKYVYKYGNKFRLINKINGGLSSARNCGIDSALGEYICFVDSDDYIDKDYLLILFNDLNIHRADMSCCLYKRTSESNEIGIIKKNTIILTGNEKIKEYLDRELYSSCCKLYHRDVFEKERFPEGMINEDIAINFRIFSNSKKIVLNESKLYFYFRRLGSVTTTPFGTQTKDLMEAWNEINNFSRGFDKEIIEKINYRRNRAIFSLLGIIAKYGFDKNIGLEERENIKQKLIFEFNKEIWLLLNSRETQLSRKITMVLFKINFEWCCYFGKLLRKFRK